MILGYIVLQLFTIHVILFPIIYVLCCYISRLLPEAHYIIIIIIIIIICGGGGGGGGGGGSYFSFSEV